jgi:ABC-type antimicrobial peptide transport system permease subunit
MLLDDRLLLGLVVIRSAAIASGAMGALALLLGSIGLYATMSFVAHQRRREVAVRAALGASPAQVRSLLTKQPARWTTSGFVVGLGLAVLASFGLSRVLRGVSPWDPAAVLLSAAAIGASAFISTYLPARRASALDPVATLRDGMEA